MGGLLLQRESQAEEEVRVAALRPAHGGGGRGLRPDQTGQPPRRGGASHHEAIAQHPHHHAVAIGDLSTRGGCNTCVAEDIMVMVDTNFKLLRSPDEQPSER